MPTAVNPYADRRTRTRGEAPGPGAGSGIHVAAYAVRDNDIPDYTTGYATELDPDYESGTTPDAIRIGAAEPPVNDPNDRRYWRKRTRELHARQTQDDYVTGWDVEQHAVAGPQNPLWTQDRPPTRPTADNSPTGYAHRRSDWHQPRFMHDVDPEMVEAGMHHVSMADHRRAFEIYGMRSHDRVGVNTFRFDPQPLAEDLYPPDQNRESQFPNTPAQTGNRSMRLG